jgi:hypothetical protein
MNNTPIGKHLRTLYQVECLKPNGEIRWADRFPNLVTTVGLNDSLDRHFKASAYTASWFVGMVSGSATFALADTMASHAGWAERTDYSESVRQTLTLGTVAAGSVNNSSNKAVFSITGTMTFGGAFLVNLPTKGQTSGTVYGGGTFSGGDRQAFAGDTINVTLTLSASN